MQLTNKGKYALRALLALADSFQARDKKTLNLGEIAVQKDISVKFLEQIMRDLKRAGLVQSWKGKSGGYCLSESPERISLDKILSSIEGKEFTADERELRLSIEKRHPDSAIYRAVLDAKQAAQDVLAGITLQDLLLQSRQYAAAQKVPMYYI